MPRNDSSTPPPDPADAGAGEAAGDAVTDLAAHARRLEEHRETALRFACRMLGDRHDAEEAVQETFMRLLKAAGQFRGESAFRTYVFSAVRNACLDVRRRRMTRSGRRREINPATTAFFRNLAPGTRFMGVSTQVQVREAQEIVRAAIDLLPDKQRDCMILHDLEGLSYKETGQVLGIKANYVGVLLYHARTGLRSLIEEGGFFSAD
jgi:RNA polymerase sigma-70 factor (ECF subfamily)